MCLLLEIDFVSSYNYYLNWLLRACRIAAASSSSSGLILQVSWIHGLLKRMHVNLLKCSPPRQNKIFSWSTIKLVINKIRKILDHLEILYKGDVYLNTMIPLRL
jgi:hypothetical protein